MDPILSVEMRTKSHGTVTLSVFDAGPHDGHGTIGRSLKIEYDSHGRRCKYERIVEYGACSRSDVAMLMNEAEVALDEYKTDIDWSDEETDQ